MYQYEATNDVVIEISKIRMEKINEKTTNKKK